MYIDLGHVSVNALGRGVQSSVKITKGECEVRFRIWNLKKQIQFNFSSTIKWLDVLKRIEKIIKESACKKKETGIKI